jgi:hypothetical protein
MSSLQSNYSFRNPNSAQRSWLTGNFGTRDIHANDVKEKNERNDERCSFRFGELNNGCATTIAESQ